MFDHGLTVGDGVFETAKVVDGVAVRADPAPRPAGALGRAGSALDPDPTRLRCATRSPSCLAANADAARRRLRLRITLTGGTGPLGSDRGDGRPDPRGRARPGAAAWPPTAQPSSSCPWTRNERAADRRRSRPRRTPRTSWPWPHAQGHGRQRGPLRQHRGQLCEGTGSNVFVVLDGELVTPPLSPPAAWPASPAPWSSSGPARSSGTCRWVRCAQADEVFLTSSTRDVQAVHAVGDDAYPDAPGPLTRQAAATFAERAAADVDP